MPIERQNPDGSYSPAEPIGPQGWKARLEFALRGHGRVADWIANRLGDLDERGLGK